MLNIVIIGSIIFMALLPLFFWKKDNSKNIINGMLVFMKDDKRFINNKVYYFISDNCIGISETGFICIKTKNDNYKTININDINSFEVIINNVDVANVSGAVVGGFLFGSVGAIIGGLSGKEIINSFYILFKINNFNAPVLRIELINGEIKKTDDEYINIKKLLEDMFSSLAILEKKYKSGGIV